VVSVEEVMLIFDSFPSGDAAKKFAAHVKEEFGRESSIAWSIESSNARLVSPIVLVLGSDEYTREQKTVASEAIRRTVCWSCSRRIFITKNRT
jgi:hypothetical protein